MKFASRIASVAIVGLAFVIAPSRFNAAPSVYPTGTTIYKPDKAWSGYVIFDTIDEQGTVLIDMNGNVLRVFTEISAVPSPARILPGGFVVGTRTSSGIDRNDSNRLGRARSMAL